MKKIMTVIISVLFVVALVSVSSAQMGMGGRGMGGRGMGGQGSGRNMEGPGTKQSLDMATAVPDFVLIDLNLTQEQTSQITVLRESLVKDLHPLKEAVFAERLNLNELRAGTPKDEKIAASQNEIKSIRNRMQDRTAQYLQAVRRILTPEQRSILRQYWSVWDGGYIIHKD